MEAARTDSEAARPRRLVARFRPIGLLFLVAVVIRVAAWTAAADSPVFDTAFVPQSDMAHFDDWARAIAAGDWLSARIELPVHVWHRDIAGATLRAEAGTTARLDSSGPSDVAVRQVFDRWLAPRTFYQDPLYPYLLAVAHGALGAGAYGGLRLLQVLAGIAAAGLLYAVTCSTFGGRVAWLATILYLGYGVFVSHELAILRDSLLAPLWLLSVLLAIRCRRGASVWEPAALGLVLAVATLLKSTAILLAAALGVGLAVAMLSAARRACAAGTTGAAHSDAPPWSPRGWSIRLTAGVIGFAVGYSPVVMRNLAVGAPAFQLASSGPVGFAFCNSPSYRPERPLDFSASEIAAIMRASNGRFGPAVVATIRAHAGVGHYLWLLHHKLQVALAPFELPNNINHAYVRLHVPVLRLLPATFALIAGLGLVGLALLIPRFAEVWPLYAMVAASLAPLVLFYTLTRYRLPLAAALCPFAAWTLERGWSMLRERRVRALLFTVGLGVVLQLWLRWQPQPVGGAIQVGDWIGPIHTYYGPRARAAFDGGDAVAAARILGRGLEVIPPELEHLGPGHRATDASTQALATTFGRAYRAYAGILLRAGEPERAAAARQRGMELLDAAGASTVEP